MRRWCRWCSTIMVEAPCGPPACRSHADGERPRRRAIAPRRSPFSSMRVSTERGQARTRSCSKTDRFPERLAALAQADPERPAIYFDAHIVTRGALDRLATRIAAALVAAGVGPEAIVAVALGRRPEAVAAFLGVMRAGAGLPADRPGLSGTGDRLPARRFRRRGAGDRRGPSRPSAVIGPARDHPARAAAHGRRNGADRGARRRSPRLCDLHIRLDGTSERRRRRARAARHACRDDGAGL